MPAATGPERAFTLFQERLDDIRRVNDYQLKTPKPLKPRINKGAVNKWQEGGEAQKRYWLSKVNNIDPRLVRRTAVAEPVVCDVRHLAGRLGRWRLSRAGEGYVRLGTLHRQAHLRLAREF
ncbi:MAG: hypothetical protein PHR16_16830 [Methylovulum sp.]|nr:hypothetical protein [Methylovulum sp.]